LADEREEIRSRIDIVDLVGREIPLKQKGKHWTGLCPFHADKNPSFTVSPDTGRYKCWSCGAAGDIFNWVMKRRNVDFAEAIQMLAKEAGVELRRGAGIPESVRSTYSTAMDTALAFFRNELKKSSFALDYCRGRGLDPETIERWRLGYAPDLGEGLPVQLKKAGVLLAEAKTLFLVDEDAGGGFYAKFRRRLMFPIYDEKGVLVAFGGRLLGDGHPKYINSSDTPLYRKSRVLYGMQRARDPIAKSRQAVLVEGYLDVIACHRAGVETAVASLGTALAEDHAKLLKRWCDEVVILYDSDDAGQKAAERSIDILRTEGLRVRIALMPAGEDPDTLLGRDGPAAVRAAVERSVSPTDYRIQALERRVDPARDEFWPEAAAILAAEPAEIEIVRHLDRLAGIYPATRDLQLAKTAIRASIAKARKAGAAPATAEMPRPATPGPASRAPAPRRAFSEMKSAEIVVFLALLAEEFRREGWRIACAGDLFESGLARKISEAVRTRFPQAPPEGRPADWLARLEDPELEALLSDLTFDSRGDCLSAEVVADSIEKLDRSRRLRKMRVAQKEGDLGQVHQLLKELKPDSLVQSPAPDDLF
jgi:DNA primase